MKKLSLFLVILVSSCTSTLYAPPPITATTVKITNLAQNSGGSGTVVSHSEGKSTILTNAHVCEVAKNGGLVTSTVGIQASVASYVTSQVHDLCLITVYKDFLVSATISLVAPAIKENALISGHPHLYPNVVTKGHFAENIIQPVMYGFRACTPEEASNPATAILCALIGQMPLVKNYESTLVTATIMPGSSGSGIFNSSGELSAVVFAGSGELGYALAVPYEYVRNFLSNEVKGLEPKKPNMDLSFAEEQSSKKIVATYADVCAKTESLKDNKVCEYVLNTSIKPSRRR